MPRPAIEARLTILPRCWRFMIGTTAWVKSKVPLRLKSISRCHSAKVSSSTPAPELAIMVLPPTALTRMSIPQNSSCSEETVASTCPASRASQSRPWALPPPARNADTASPRRSWWLSTPTTTAPSRAMISAVARLIPLANAVMTATLSVNRIVPPFVSALANALSPSRRTRVCACRMAHLRCAQTSTGERTMQLGIHLPHAGSQATPALIKRHAQRAEALGLSDVWVSEHIIVPRAQFPRSPLFYDPILTLTWVASVTERVRLGTSVIVLPMRHPLPLAKELATLHNLSGGRLILGVGVGWLEPEFAALGVPFNERGRRMDEGIAMMRAVWSQDPVSFDAKYIPAAIKDMTMLPQPVSHIPMWHGSRSEAAHRRTVRIRDGWHGSQVTPEQGGEVVKRLRRDRPEPGFTISVRSHWDGKDVGMMRERVTAYAAAGVQHVMVHPQDREVDDWDTVIEGVGRVATG